LQFCRTHAHSNIPQIHQHRESIKLKPCFNHQPIHRKLQTFITTKFQPVSFNLQENHRAKFQSQTRALPLQPASTTSCPAPPVSNQASCCKEEKKKPAGKPVTSAPTPTSPDLTAALP
jgi:hypothetical protein